jgi:hypothetical protein
MVLRLQVDVVDWLLSGGEICVGEREAAEKAVWMRTSDQRYLVMIQEAGSKEEGDGQGMK